MWQVLSQFSRDILTGIDGESWDVGRVLWVLAFLVGIGLEIYSVLQKTPFDLQAYGLGVGGLLVAGGFSLKLKASTEPGEKQ